MIWVNLRNMLSKRIQTQKSRCYILHLYEVLDGAKLVYSDGNQKWFFSTELWERETGKYD